MRMDEFQSACEEVKLSKQQADKILRRAKGAVREKQFGRRKNSLPALGYVSGLAAVVLIFCAVGISILWKDANRDAALSKNVVGLTDTDYSFVVYVTEYEPVIDKNRNMMMIMAVSVDTEEKCIEFEPVSVDRYLENWSEDGELVDMLYEEWPAKQVDELFEEFGPELTTKLLAEKLELAADDYIVLDRLKFAEFIDDCGGMCVDITWDDILYRNIRKYELGVDYYDEDIGEINRESNNQIPSVPGQCSVGGSLAIGWALCAEERNEYDLGRERQIELFANFVEISRDNKDQRWINKMQTKLEERAEEISRPEVVMDILTGNDPYIMNKR